MRNIPNKYKVISYALRALALAILIAAFVALFVFPDFNKVRMITMVLLIATPFLIKMSNDYRRKSSGEIRPVSINSTTRKGPSKRLVISGIALLPVTGASWLLLAMDFQDGWNEIWPLYACVAVSVICGIAWSAIFALWMGKLTSQG